MKLLFRGDASPLCQTLRPWLMEKGAELTEDPAECEAVLWFTRGEEALVSAGEHLLSQLRGGQSVLLLMPYGLWESEDALARAAAAAACGAAGAWSRRYASRGIRVNCLRYGCLAGEAVPDWVALQRGAAPEEIARAVWFFLGEGTSFMTGQIIDVNGGRIY